MMSNFENHSIMISFRRKKEWFTLENMIFNIIITYMISKPDCAFKKKAIPEVDLILGMNLLFETK